MAMFFVPVYFGLTASLLTMLLLWKGGGYTINLTDVGIVLTIIFVGVGFGLLMCVTLMPWIYRVVVCEDWELRWWHIPMGLLLLRRGAPPPPPEDGDPVVRDYYEGRQTKAELDARKAEGRNDVEITGGADSAEKKTANADASDVGSTEPPAPTRSRNAPKKLVGPKPEGKWYSGNVLFWYLKFALLRGIDQDVISAQNEKSALASNLAEVHAHADHFDNKAEYMYSFLQVMTAATASFTHGANDIANAIGPYATVYQIWSSDGRRLSSSGKTDVPVWILVFGGACLVIGVWTYGYNIMRNLGHRLTLQSPSRGFSMELGSAITVILATRLSKCCPTLGNNMKC
jgi:sodium-dependent phosphate transporter